ncbi:MAG: peptidoglycan editing factor PgeF [Pyrinomonadaceae bacterium]|nr:peptidoglycan editing factor PgeF [Phycisphaerales bacterium]
MLERRVHPQSDDAGNPVVLYVSPLLQRALGGIHSDIQTGPAAMPRHGFSTRLGGVSAGPCASMNLGNRSRPGSTISRWTQAFRASDHAGRIKRYWQYYYVRGLASRYGNLMRTVLTWRVCDLLLRPFQTQDGNPRAGIDPRRNLAINHHRILEAAGLNPYLALCRVHQVHGATVLRLSRGVEHDPHAKADAIVSDDPSRIVSVRVADCVPVLLSSVGGSIVAAVHAGWRGIVAGVVPGTVRYMTTDATHGIAPGELVAAIGPCIGMDAFEVGPEVVIEFRKVFGESVAASFIRPGKLDRHHIDLRAAVRRQLLEAGLLETNIDSTDRCTHRDAEEFFSHRRENGLTGRMAAFIAAGGGDGPARK